MARVRVGIQNRTGPSFTRRWQALFSWVSQFESLVCNDEGAGPNWGIVPNVSRLSTYFLRLMSIHTRITHPAVGLLRFMLNAVYFLSCQACLCRQSATDRLSQRDLDMVDLEDTLLPAL